MNALHQHRAELGSHSAVTRVTSLLDQVEQLTRGRTGRVRVWRDRAEIGSIYDERGALCLADCAAHRLTARLLRQGFDRQKLRALVDECRAHGTSTWVALSRQFALDELHTLLHHYIADVLEWLSGEYDTLRFDPHVSSYRAPLLFRAAQLVTDIAERYYPRPIEQSRTVLQQVAKNELVGCAFGPEYGAEAPILLATTSTMQRSLAELTEIGNFVVSSLRTSQRIAAHHQLTIATGQGAHNVVWRSGASAFYVECSAKKLGRIVALVRELLV